MNCHAMRKVGPCKRHAPDAPVVIASKKAINQFVLLLERLQLPSPMRRVPHNRFVSLAVFQVGFMARQRGKISAVQVQWKRGNPGKARERKGEERRGKSMPGDNFFPFPCLRPVKLKSLDYQKTDNVSVLARLLPVRMP